MMMMRRRRRMRRIPPNALQSQHEYTKENIQNASTQK
jgi:hypothetical protein